MKTRNEEVTYRIIVEAGLDPQWKSVFSNMNLSKGENGQTILEGKIIDQAALHGIIRKIRDLVLPIISIERRKK